ncbi:DUF1254 domain-containing protein [Mesorhizobium sp. LjRoot246]|uniref:DUF1254 domain-containing protein n=1 Tax=Mesorhizobium sp. LjRoot246 TaxID=3342294 RepID=UPI003ED15186
MFKTIVAGLILSASAATSCWAADKIPVTPDNFARAESDMYLAKSVKEEGAFGKLTHKRQPVPIDKQTVIRMNRDTLYSSGVFDLDAGPVTLTLPDTGTRFMSMQVLDEDQYTAKVVYGTESNTFTKDQVGTRYLFVAVRTLVDPTRPGDLDEVHKLQDAIKVDQPGGPGKFEVPNWDEASQTKVRDALLALASTMSDFSRAFGSKAEVDPVHFLIGAAAGWGGNPDKDATYKGFTPKGNDGKTVYRLHVPVDIPVDAFWSISRYDAKGFFEANDLNAYSLNNLTATKGSDGSVDVQFGGCDGKVPNCLPIDAGWNYMVRLYRPRPEVLNGTWKFPEAQPVN